MQTIDLVVETEISTSIRARQVGAMFDCPSTDKCSLSWRGQIDIDERPWSVGLIVGPSGCGKSSVMRSLWGNMPKVEWIQKSVVDDFPKGMSLDTITTALGSVGFNTIPAWLRPFHVLSNGEQFRADLARRLCELPSPIVVDEFTSVVDRQVAQIGSHAIQKTVRRQGKQFVAVTCHYDVIEWLQPDWILEPATMTLTWRSVQPRPIIQAEFRRCEYDLWKVFAPYHYMSANLHKAARCFALYVNGRPVAFNGALHRPHPKVRDIMGSSRTVVLPDWQGLNLGMVMGDALGSAYKAIGKRFHRYPAHPAFIRAHDRSTLWTMTAKPTPFNVRNVNHTDNGSGASAIGGRPCAVFEYVGAAMEDRDLAQRFLNGDTEVHHASSS